MLFQNAAVHDHLEACRARLRRSRLMHHAFLHPYSVRADADSCIDQFGDVLGPPEDVDDINMLRNVLEFRVLFSPRTSVSCGFTGIMR